MLKFLFLVALLFAVALGLHALSNASGDVALTFGDTVYSVSLSTALIGAIVFVLLAMALIWFLREIFRAPWRVARGVRRRNRERGHEAVAEGLVAIAAGDVRQAERAALEAARRVPNHPLTLLLRAQTAQLKGDRDAAREVFHRMTENLHTRVAGLRGLHIEAEREGEADVAHQIAARARAEAPAAPWAARALMRHQTAAADWDAALATLSGATDARIIDRRTARRHRAVILTAKAFAKEESEPDVARAAALEAHDLARDLVPAAVVAGRLLARQGDIRRATRVLEAAWKAEPHPEIADAYMHVRTGDAASDRLKRAETLHRLRPRAAEGRRAVARAAIDAREFARARDVLKPLVASRPTQQTLILMGEIEEAESGDRGRAREWLARAVYAPRDPAWTADGVVLEAWAPVSPVTGRLDTVEWKVPLTEIEAPRLDLPGEAPAVIAAAPALEADRAPIAPPAAILPETPAPAIGGSVAAAEAPAPTPGGTEAKADGNAVTAGRAETKTSGPGTGNSPAETRPSPIRAPVPLAGNAGKAADQRIAEPPRPDDPGVSDEDAAAKAEERRRSLPAFLRGS